MPLYSKVICISVIDSYRVKAAETSRPFSAYKASASCTLVRDSFASFGRSNSVPENYADFFLQPKSCRCLAP